MLTRVLLPMDTSEPDHGSIEPVSGLMTRWTVRCMSVFYLGKVPDQVHYGKKASRCGWCDSLGKVLQGTCWFHICVNVPLTRRTYLKISLCHLLSAADVSEPETTGDH